MGAGHAHSPDGWRRDGAPSQRRLAAALAVTGLVCAVELVGGRLTGSLALVSDGGHMLADAFALGLALFAVRFASLPATAAKTYGYCRLEILSALANGLLLAVTAIFIFIEAFRRFVDPQPIAAAPMLAVAAVGLGANLISIRILSDAANNLSVRGAYLHVVADALSSVGVIVAGIAVYLTGEVRIDPLIGAMIATVILWSAQRLVRESVDVLLEAIPKGIDLEAVGAAILAIDGVVGMHDLHVWSLTTGVSALSAHVLVERDDLGATDRILEAINRDLLARFQIDHTTIQVESGTASHVGTVHA